MEATTPDLALNPYESYRPDTTTYFIHESVYIRKI